MNDVKFYVGIDGGGTYTKAVLVSSSGELFGWAQGGTINYYSVPFEEAKGNLEEVLSRLTERIDAERISRVFIGCSALESVYIPAGVTTIVSRDGESPFYMCDPEILTVKCEAGSEGANWDDGYDVCNYIEYDDTTKPTEAVRIKFEFGQKG